MHPADFPQKHLDLARPGNMAPGECSALPVHRTGTRCISLWRASWRERLSLLVFGRVWLSVRSGDTQPPVALQAQRTVFMQPAIPHRLQAWWRAFVVVR